MSAATEWLRVGSVLACAATPALIGHCYFSDPAQPGQRWIQRYREGLDAKLHFLRMRYSGRRVFFAQLAVALLLLGTAGARNSFVPLILLPIAAWGPTLDIDRRVAKRVGAIEAQIEPWLVAVANALKASPSLGEAIASSATLLPPPISQEIDLLVKEYELGTSLDRALGLFAERIRSKTLTGAVLALQVARNSGGNLPEMLENASAALRELARLEGVVRTKTAEGKAQAFVIGVIPLPMVVGIHFLDRHFFEPLLTSFTGELVIGAAVVLWAAAILLASKILAVDV